MIITVDELKTFITTDKNDTALQAMLEGLEAFIVKYTNNDFKNRSTGLADYPASIKTAVFCIMGWEFKKEAVKTADGTSKPVQSETISRHSVTYATDATESDIDCRTGLPKKYTAVFDLYKRARF